MKRRKYSLSGFVFLTAIFIVFALPFSSIKGEGTDSEIYGLQVKHDVPLRWHPLEKGLDYSRMEFKRVKDERSVTIAAFRVDPALFEFKLLSAPRLTSSKVAPLCEMHKKSKALISINASFYAGEDALPTGMVVSNKKIMYPWSEEGGSGILRYNENKLLIEWAKEYSSKWGKRLSRCPVIPHHCRAR